MKLNIQSSFNKKFMIDIENDITVDELVSKVSDKLGMTKKYISFTYNGKLMDSNDQLSKHITQNDDTVYMIYSSLRTSKKK
jgi:Ubiquitin-like domain